MSTDASWSPAKRKTRVVGTGGCLANRLVERASDGTVVLAAAGSVLTDGCAQATKNAADLVTVISGEVMKVQYAAAAAPGQKLVAAANGQVTPAGTTPDARTLVGKCEEVVAGAGIYQALIYQ